jgi:hypothetical protein
VHAQLWHRALGCCGLRPAGARGDGCSY